MAKPYNLRSTRKKEALPQDQPAIKRKTAAEYQREYRARLKANTELYKKHRQYESLRVQVILGNLSEEKKAQYRETTRNRVRRFRAKQAELNKGKPPIKAKKKKAPPKTRDAKLKQRVKWAEAKRRQRAKQSSQARRRENEKRRKRYAERNAEKANKASSSRVDDTTITSDDTVQGIAFEACDTVPTSDEAIRKAALRAEQAMPRTSQQYAEVLARMIHKSTPMKKKVLDGKGISTLPSTPKFTRESSASVKRLFDTLNKQRNKKAMKRKRILAVAVSVKNRYKPGYRNHHKFLGIGKRLTKHAITANDADELEVRKKRKDATPVENVTTVKEFFLRGDNSRDLPDARSAKKVGDEVKSRKVMDLTLRCAYEKFCTEYPSINLSFSKFKTLRPPNILTMSNNKRAQCLCEYCTNLEFKLDTISRYMAQHHLGQFPFKNKHDISRITLCPKENEEYKKVCLDRQCNLCGIQLLKFEELVPHAADEIRWFRWETKEFDYDGGLIKRMTKVHKNGTLHQLIQELKMEMAPFSKHLFNASWQWRQYDHVSKNMPPNWVIFCMDYAENFACQSQDEAQGAHWSNVQATIHPTVASYRCEEADCDKIVTDSLFFISNDIKHCYHGVHHFNKLATDHLEGKGIQIAKLIHFTDGSPTQYKSKVNFADVSMSLDDFGFPTEKHYFGSRHGKGPCDREIGVLKKQANLAINARQVEIANAHDLFSFGQAKLTRPKDQNEHCHEKRSFFFVKRGEIDRDRPDRTDVKPLKGTLQMHCVCGTGDPYKVYSRERSCFCLPCTTGVNECQYEDLVGKWKVSDLKKQKAHTVDTGDLENRDNTETSCRDVQQPDLEVRDAITSNSENAVDAQKEQGLHLTAQTDISIGEYVAVKLPVSQRKNSSTSTLIVYMALVMDKVDDDFVVKFMRNHSGFYSFPEQERPFTHPRTDILCKVQSPSLRNHRAGNQYIFAEEDIKKVCHSVTGNIILK